ncbi:hypothetical protein U91I_01227 [alpha proteobacterium U9-1i]|nr:hypothetical protein U91I_01227 [alpha proteobacterium U9-1i]
MRASLLCLALIASACGVSAQSAPSPTPDWLSGYWLSCDGGQVAENWIGAGSGTLLGTNLTRGEHAGFEFLRIAANANGGFSYYSMPSGRSPATEFAMVSLEGERAVFENLAHDFPQRIIYARAGDRLNARIESADSSEGMDWNFRRAEIDAACE